MTIDKKIIIIAVEALFIIILAIMLVNEKTVKQDKEDAYLQELKEQNKELSLQLDRLKKNYIDIGLLDSVQTRNMDSLIAISSRKADNLREEAKTYRDALEEMKTREWKRLSEAQKTKEIEEALNYLSEHEQ